MPSGIVTVNGARIAFHQCGRGEPLVCLHGGMGIDSSYLRVPAVVGLTSGRRRVVTYDQRGHGASDRSPPETYSHAQWAADLHGLSAEVARGRFALLGHSYGGFLALEFAVRHPAALGHLILVGTSAGPVRAEMPDVGSDAEVRALFRSVWPRFFPGPDKHWDVFDRIAFSWEPFAEAFRRELPRYDLRGAVSGLDVPTLLVVGSEDHYRSDMEWLAGQLPRARMTVIPAAGHLPFLDAPEAYAAAVADFLDDRGAGGRTGRCT